MPAGDDLDLLVHAARASGELALAHWRHEPRVWDKGRGLGPVSEADLEVDRFLRDRLTAARPSYGWLSEEATDDRSRLECDRVFIVDPIDGTRVFLEGQTAWAVSLAVAHRGQIETAAVIMPASNKLYTATRNGGARLNGEPLAASVRTELPRAQVLAPRVALSPEMWHDCAVPPVKRSFRASLAYRLCLVAEGRFDAMMTFRDCWEWDIAAGALIAHEASATVSDRTGAALRFNTPDAMTFGAVAAAPALHHALLPPRQAP